MASQIKLGTDGWRALIGEEFTLANVERVAGAFAAHLRDRRRAGRKVVIGFDTRFLSPEAAEAAAETVRSAGIDVILADRPTPTPALSYAVVSNHASGGIVITASHNPCRWNGVKFKADYGGSVSIGIAREIEKRLAQKSAKALRRAGKSGSIERRDLVTPYLENVKRMVDLDSIRSSGFRFALDPMFGAGRGCLARIFSEAGIPSMEIHGEHNPLFPGLNPEPIEPHVEALRSAVLEGGYDAGFATDGDADRIGAMDRSGAFVDSHKIFSILLVHLVVDRKKTGEVIKTFSSTDWIDRLGRRYGLKVHTTRIGFKYICALMLTRNVLMAGEESGGLAMGGQLPERDGILNALLLAEVMAERGKLLSGLIEEIAAAVGRLEYKRMDLEMDRAAAQRIIREVGQSKHLKIGGLTATTVEILDGAKLRFGDAGWILFRASGTENLLRLYAEFPAKSEVRRMLDAMAEFARSRS